MLSVGTELAAALITCVLIKPGKLISDFANRKTIIDEKVKNELLNYYKNER